MKKITVIGLLLIIGFNLLSQNKLDILQKNLNLDNKDWGNQLYIKNTIGIRVFRPDTNKTELRFSISSIPINPLSHFELGTRDNNKIISTEFNSVLKNNQYFRCNAEYKNGKSYNRKFNLTSDIEKVYPYTPAENNIGKNIDCEEYNFGGGYIKKYDSQINIGGYVSYKALKEIRTKDPRPYNISSDLNFKFGTTIKLQPWIVGLDILGEIYHQKQDLSFFSVAGAGFIFQRLGLDDNSMRFLGNWLSSKYQGKGIGFQIFLLPEQLQGFSATYKLKFFGCERRLTKGNYLPLNNLRHIKNNLGISYSSSKLFARGWSYVISFNLDYNYRLGINNLFGKSTRIEYPLIASVKSYENEFSRYSLNGNLNYRGRNSYNQLNISCEYNMNSETMKNEPKYVIESHLLYSAGYRRTQKLFSNLILSGEINYTFHPKIKGRINLPEQDEDPAYKTYFQELRAEIRNNLIRKSNRFSLLDLSFRLNYYFNNLSSIYMGIRGLAYIRKNQDSGFNLSLGYKF